MDDVRSVLQKADAQLIAIDTLAEADLEQQRVSPTLRGKIRGFLENERAALDQLALRVVAATGSEETHVHFPMAPWPAGFEASIDKNMPGVRDKAPEVVAVVARHQPFTVVGLARLRELLVDEKKQHLTPATKPAPPEPEAPAPESEPAPPVPAPPPPPAGGLGAGLTGPMFINGIEYDPITLKPINPVAQARRDKIYVEWLLTMEAGEVPLLTSLQSIQAAVAVAVDEVSAAAGFQAPPL